MTPPPGAGLVSTWLGLKPPTAPTGEASSMLAMLDAETFSIELAAARPLWAMAKIELTGIALTPIALKGPPREMVAARLTSEIASAFFGGALDGAHAYPRHRRRGLHRFGALPPSGRPEWRRSAELRQADLCRQRRLAGRDRGLASLPLAARRRGGRGGG